MPRPPGKTDRAFRSATRLAPAACDWTSSRCTIVVSAATRRTSKPAALLKWTEVQLRIHLAAVKGEPGIRVRCCRGREDVINRCPDPSNRRNQPVALTDRGLRLVGQIAPDHFSRLAAAIVAFSPAKRQTMRCAVVLLHRFGQQLLEGLPAS